MSESSQFVRRLAAYVRERFPAHLAFIYAAIFGLSVASFGTDSIHFGNIASAQFIIVVGTMFLFFARLRFTDEIKDYSYDITNHPERPVSRGAIQVKEIKGLLFITLIIEFILQAVNNAPGVIMYLVFFVYSFAIFKNFFLKHSFTSSHLFLTLILHQFVFVIYAIFALYTYEISVSPLSFKILLFIIFLSIPPFMFEVGRKLEHRVDQIGRYTDDTYIYQWGLKRSFTLLICLGLAQSVTLVVLLKKPYWGFLYGCILLVISIIFFFRPQWVAKTAKSWSVIIALISMIVFILDKLI